jgi:hypothetical protein
VRRGRVGGRGRISGYVCHFAEDLLGWLGQTRIGFEELGGSRGQVRPTGRNPGSGAKCNCSVSPVGQGPDAVSGGCP